MRMQQKLMAYLLLAGLVTAGAVGAVAYWMLMRNFSEAILQRSFENFQSDVGAYISTYGSWEAASAAEPFGAFVRQRHGRQPFLLGGPMPPPGGTILRREPPFHFLLLDGDGVVLQGVAGHPLGSQVQGALLQKARAVEHAGKVVALALPIGEPILSPPDRSYLMAMRQALLTGFAVAVLLAIVVGLLAGRRMGQTLRALTDAVHAMQQDREARVQVPVRSADEIGELASAFNRMNGELSRAHRELRESSEMVQKQADKLLELSVRDPLTNLFNRRHFDECAEKYYQQAVRYGHPLSVMIGDIDHFKKINDNLSHAVGDEVIRKVAALLAEGIRESDIVARYGGEEFVILFPETPLNHALPRCEELRRRIEEYPWQEISPDMRVTMSMGLNDVLDAGSVEKMLARADEQLYAAKSGGRNKVHHVMAAA